MKVIKEYLKRESSGKENWYELRECPHCKGEWEVRRTSQSNSCGCQQYENKVQPITHGDCANGTRSKLHNMWVNMRQRCNNPKHPNYKHYGGRGIYVCEAWDKFIHFREWAIEEGYKEGLELDRRDNNLNYNCRFTTRVGNLMNKRNSLSNRFSNDEKKVIRDKNLNGFSLRQLAKDYKIDATSVKKLIDMANDL